ncbi:BRO1 domain-containing protein [Meloidogyne graminicola]|uniref:BRO1 domain-containing protein n=1 Tax=Meloidogyne graminicola TaxID=189291 RepID=A0A8S9ZEA2_9BILA|nr:BRO1 domain-containing protein [Meloidogyne graminicola]
MEGMPRVPMAVPEMRYIALHFHDDPNKYDSSLDELEHLRMIVSHSRADVESICVAKRYFAQLLMMKKRFPMEEHDPIAIPFAWTDRSSDLMNQLVYEDINFEMCCVMFNIGVAHSQVAAGESRMEMDSIKNAFMHFQWASWPLQYLRDHMGASRFSFSDFEAPFLTFYLNIFLAQAQECMLEKSMIDHRKPVVIAKVALQTHIMYRNCDAYLKGSGISDLLSSSKYSELERLCATKVFLYSALYNYYLGQQAEDEKQFGVRLFYFARALDLVKSAQKVVEKEKKKRLIETVQFAYDVIVLCEGNARRENDFVYHERVLMVKPLSFDPCEPSVAGDDLFRELLPTDVIKTVSMYSEEKDKFKREVLDLVAQKDSELENYLISMKFDQLELDRPSEMVRLPDELLTASAALAAQPDLFCDLLDNFQKVSSLATESETKLSELKQRMARVTDSFFTNDQGFIAISKKLEELSKHEAQAKENNTELQRAMATHSSNLKMLSMPLSDLTKKICGDFTNLGESPEGKELRRVINKVDEMRSQRCTLIKQLRDDLEIDDISKKALTERELDPKQLFGTEIQKHNKIKELIEQNLRAQALILKALTEANANFADCRRQILEANERRAMQSLTLVTAYQTFIEIVEKTNKALEFYDQLLKVLAALERGITHEKEKKRQAEESKIRAEMAAYEEKLRKDEAAREASRTLSEFRFNRV